MIENLNGKLTRFAALLNLQQLEGLKRNGVDCEANRNNCATSVKVGPKYSKVDIGSSGRYMVVNATGEIYGIKGYGVIHRGHAFGTLDTINEWYWGDYRACRVPSNPEVRHPANPAQVTFQPGDKAMLVGFDDDRDGKLVTVLEVGSATALVDAPDYRANISLHRLASPPLTATVQFDEGDISELCFIIDSRGESGTRAKLQHALRQLQPQLSNR